MKSKVHTLDKETRRRHFPEFDGGKGSHPRSSTKETREVYKDNFDAIDWSKPLPSRDKEQPI